jgi:putative flippase GtrA
VNDLARRPSRTPRRQRERRAYQLVVVGGTAGAVAVVGFVLAIAGVIGAGVPLIAAIVAVVCALWFRGTVGR